MSTPVLADGTEVRTSPATARPLLLGGMAALSAGAAAIHFAVTFEHFSEYSLYGVFFLVLAWAQLVWPVVLVALPFLTWGQARAQPARFPAGWSRSRLTPLAARRLVAWLWLGIAGNAGVLVIYLASRSIGLPIGPDTTTVEAWGGLDLVCAVEEILLVVIAAAVLARPGLLARPVRFRSQARSLAGLLAAPVVVIAATTAVMTPAWAGSEGPAGMASGPSGSSSSSSSMAGSPDSLQGGMSDMGSTDGQPDMRMYGATNPPTAAQVQAAANLIKQTDASLARFENVNKAFGDIFSSLFGGGTARMQLLDEEDVLESGIELVAQPPGKRNQSIALLSGGERALTALALLFAIFRYKPSPFCILDEVDAPLDEVNNERFVRLVRQMSHDTQFIVITHSRRTMEAADVLYGVTMEEAGCSRLVSVNFADVDA